MKNLELNRMEILRAGDDVQDTCMGASITMMSFGIAFAFTGGGAILLFSGAILGYICAD